MTLQRGITTAAAQLAPGRGATMHHLRFGLLTLVTILAAACAPARPTTGGEPGAAQQAPAEARTLSAVLRVEPFDLTDSASSRNRLTLAMFGATLAYMDAND